MLSRNEMKKTRFLSIRNVNALLILSVTSSLRLRSVYSPCSLGGVGYTKL